MSAVPLSGDPRPAVLVVLSGGGFSLETKLLLGHLAAGARLVYLCTEFGGAPGDDMIPDGRAYAVPSFATVTQRSVRQSLYAFARTFAATVRAIRRERIKAVVGIGCSHLVPMLLAGRLLGCRTAFIETITRSDRLSATGRIIYHLRLCQQFFVQWPGLRGRYPRAELGTIL